VAEQIHNTRLCRHCIAENQNLCYSFIMLCDGTNPINIGAERKRRCKSIATEKYSKRFKIIAFGSNCIKTRTPCLPILQKHNYSNTCITYIMPFILRSIETHLGIPHRRHCVSEQNAIISNQKNPILNIFFN
jgi:hypothetical protein